jgi:hypothetical protein
LDGPQKKTIMKKQYTKKQIAEAINYWKKQLDKMNESSSRFSKYSHAVGDSYPNDDDPYGYGMTWGEFKAKVDKYFSDNDRGFNIALLSGPNQIGYGEIISYVDIDDTTKTIVASVAN